MVREENTKERMDPTLSLGKLCNSFIIKFNKNYSVSKDNSRID